MKNDIFLFYFIEDGLLFDSEYCWVINDNWSSVEVGWI